MEALMQWPADSWRRREREHHNLMRVVRNGNSAVVTCNRERYDLYRWSNLVRDLGTLDVPVVVDVERVEGNLSEIDAYLLALQLEEMHHRVENRTAIVASGEPRRGLEFLAASGRTRGLDIRIFESLSEARAWTEAS